MLIPYSSKPGAWQRVNIQNLLAIIVIIVISGRSPCRTLPAKNARSPPGSAEANAGGEHAALLPKHRGNTFATAAPTPSPFELLPQRQADHRVLLQDRSGFQLAVMSPLLTRSGKGRVRGPGASMCAGGVGQMAGQA